VFLEEKSSSPSKPVICNAIEEDLVVALPGLKQARVICLSSKPYMPTDESHSLDQEVRNESLCTPLSEANLAEFWWAKVRAYVHMVCTSVRYIHDALMAWSNEFISYQHVIDIDLNLNSTESSLMQQAKTECIQSFDLWVLELRKFIPLNACVEPHLNLSHISHLIEIQSTLICGIIH
jgi:hypothetical protein